jgi:hypothetical protein
MGRKGRREGKPPMSLEPKIGWLGSFGGGSNMTGGINIEGVTNFEGGFEL